MGTGTVGGAGGAKEEDRTGGRAVDSDTRIDRGLSDSSTRSGVSISLLLELCSIGGAQSVILSVARSTVSRNEMAASRLVRQ